GAIGTIRLDRPPMNALNAQVQGELRLAPMEATERAEGRAVVGYGGGEGVCPVIVYGGEKVFAAGADIKEMHTMSYTDMVQHSAELQLAFTSVARIPKPVVGAVAGYALGGG